MQGQLGDVSGEQASQVNQSGKDEKEAPQQQPALKDNPSSKISAQGGMAAKSEKAKASSKQSEAKKSEQLVKPPPSQRSSARRRGIQDKKKDDGFDFK